MECQECTQRDTTGKPEGLHSSLHCLVPSSLIPHLSPLSPFIPTSLPPCRSATHRVQCLSGCYCLQEESHLLSQEGMGRFLWVKKYSFITFHIVLKGSNVKLELEELCKMKTSQSPEGVSHIIYDELEFRLHRNRSQNHHNWSEDLVQCSICLLFGPKVCRCRMLSYKVWLKI